MLIKLSCESILFYICKHHWITLYEVLIRPLRFQWLQWQTVKHILGFLCLTMSLIQRISCFPQYFSLSLSQQHPEVPLRALVFQMLHKHRIKPDFKGVKALYIWGGDISLQQLQLVLYRLPCTSTQQLWPLCWWPVFQSCRDPSAAPEHPFSSYVPLLTLSFPKSAFRKKAAWLDYIWNKIHHRWRNSPSWKICHLLKLTEDRSQCLNHYLFQQKKLDS